MSSDDLRPKRMQPNEDDLVVIGSRPQRLRRTAAGAPPPGPAPDMSVLEGRQPIPERSVTMQDFQPELFTIGPKGEMLRPIADVPNLEANSSLEVARWWYRRQLEQEKRPYNTVASYMYDLALFQDYVGAKTIDKINPAEIGNFLSLSTNKSTRKRRLTSIGGLFRFLIKIAHVLTYDPSANYYPDYIPLKTPQPLFDNEQDSILLMAREESLRTYLIVYCLLRLGLTRGELLSLKAEHIDMSDPSRPIIYVFYDEQRKQGKERKLAADAEFGADLRRYQDEYQPRDHLFEMMPQSVNKLVARVAADADLKKLVTPQTLRDTYAINQSKEGADVEKLLLLLGLAPDARNRNSVRRYVKLAQPAL